METPREIVIKALETDSLGLTMYYQVTSDYDDYMSEGESLEDILYQLGYTFNDEDISIDIYDIDNSYYTLHFTTEEDK